MNSRTQELLSSAIVELDELRARLARAEGERREPLAVIGMACRFPRTADTPDAFWRDLRDGFDAVSEVPSTRWDAHAWYDPDPTRPGRMNTRWGGFIEGVDRFDCDFFELSPREARCMDPQQRLVLQVAWEALEDAGQPPDRRSGREAGVFLGVSSSDYAMLDVDEETASDPFFVTGAAHSVFAGRLSHLFDLRGPSLAVDTACSSSLVATHLACRSLRGRECDLALVGGVNVLLLPQLTRAFAKGGFMAPDGRCKAFDARANGYVRGEGCGVLVMKRLDDACADGDRIYAVIRGSAVNQDGYGPGLTAPSAVAQARVIRSALRDAGLDADRVSYVEAHGTGTSLGDPIEMAGLARVFGEGAADRDPCRVGSVKSNIGHLEAAAGVAGLMKVILALRNEQIPPTLHFRRLNPNIDTGGAPLAVADRAHPWPRGAEPRVAGVSSFSFAGTNAHVVLEEAPPVDAREEPAPDGPHLLPLSAHDEAALRARAARTAAWLREGAYLAEGTLRDVCFTAAERRAALPWRLAVHGADAGSLADRLEELAHAAAPGAPARPARPRRLALVFSGQGSLWVGMGRELHRSDAAFRESFDACAAVYAELADGASLFDALGDASLPDATATGQPVLFGVGVGLLAFWRARGLEPDGVVGHSVGEILAAYAAGILSLESALRIVVERSRAMEPLRGKGGMLSVPLAPAGLEPLAGRVCIAAHNAPAQTVVAGDAEALADLAARSPGSRAVNVAYAFHGPDRPQVGGALAEALADVRADRERLPFYSTVTGARCRGESLDADHWARNAARPVLFDAAVRAMVDDGFDAFLEIGGHPVLHGALYEVLEAAGAEGAVVAGSLRRDRPERESLLRSLAALWVAGAHVAPGSVLPPGGRVVSLPGYPWSESRHWVRVVGAAGASGDRSSSSGHPLLETHVCPAGAEGTHVFEVGLSSSALSGVEDHRVGETAVVPGAVYAEMARAAGAAVFGAEAAETRGRVVVESLGFERALVWDRESGRRLQATLACGAGDAAAEVVLWSRGAEERDWTAHARGRVRRQDPGPEAAVDLAALRERCVQRVEGEAFYAGLAAAGLDYGPAFRGVETVYAGPGEALGELAVGASPPGAWGGGLPPTLLDAAFQVVGAVAGEAAAGPWVPVGLERLWSEASGSGPWAVHARRREDGEPETLRADVSLVAAATGRVVAAVEGLELRALGSVAAGDGARVDDTYAVRWEERGAASESSGPAAPEMSGTWWVVDLEAGALSDALCRRLASAGATVRTLDAQTLADAQALSGWGAELSAAADGRGVVVLAGQAAETALPAVAADLGGAVLHGVQTLVRAGLRDAPRLWLVTRGAQAVTPEDTLPGLAAAPLWGLAKGVAHEHPELACTCVDLDPQAEPESALARLWQELCAPDGEREIAWRADTRRVQRLARFEPERDAAAPRVPTGTWRLEVSRPGSLERVRPCAVTRRAPQAEEVEIRVRAAGLNFKDVLLALGVVPGRQTRDLALGAECAGEVTRVGAAVEGLSPGDPVVAVAEGSLGSFVTAPAALVARKPDALSFAQAATLPIVFMTAHYALDRLAELEAGERVLIHAASGGVGLAALQIARQRGAEVFATAGSEAKRHYLHEQGVAHVLDSRSLDFADAIHTLTDGRGVDVVLNSLAGPAIEKNLELLAPQGRFVEIGIRDLVEDHRLGLAPFLRNLSYFALELSGLLRERPARAARLFQEVIAHFAAGRWQPLPVRTFPAAEAPAALRFMAQARQIGKLALVVDDTPLPAVAPPPGPLALHPDAAYLVTGGLGGLGLCVADWLADQGARHLVLVGRRDPDEAARPRLDALRRRGVRVETDRVDVADPDAVQACVAALGPALRGVVHAAGVLDDGILLQQDARRLQRVLAPKVHGAWNLHRATRSQPLDFFVLFSSLAALIGSPGQAPYAAANTFLDALAHHRRALGLPATSLDWGPWDRVGMAAGRTFPGIQPLPPEHALQSLQHLLDLGVTHAAVARLDLRQWSQLFPGMAELPLLEELAVSQDGAPGRGAWCSELERQDSPQARRALLTRRLRESVARVLEVDAAQLDVKRAIPDLGFSSLMAVELRNHLETALGLRLSATLMWSHPTVESLSAELARRLGFAAGAESARTETDRGTDTGTDTSELDDLSDAEVERLLVEELESLPAEEREASVSPGARHSA